MNQADSEPLSFDDQASACLLAATQHRARLLAVATKLTGSAEAGMDLFQQACLDCHDAIQRRGFQGDRYEFYLLTSLKNLHYKLAKEARRTRATDFQESQDYQSDYTGALYDPDQHAGPGVPTALPDSPHSERESLAEQVAAEAQARFSFPERVVLRLHADGYSCQEITELTGYADRYRVRHLLDRLKESLRRTFGQAWQALLD